MLSLFQCHSGHDTYFPAIWEICIVSPHSATSPPNPRAAIPSKVANLNREYEDDKLCILDVRVTTSSGKDVDVEIQLQASSELYDRIQCYVARMVAEKVNAGGSYKLTQSISIVILDHLLLPGNKTRYHHRFRLYDSEAALEYPNSMEIHTLELPKIPKNNDSTRLWKWLRFISSKTQEEIMPLTKEDPVMSEALLKLLDMSGDLATRRRAEARAKFLWDQAAREHDSRKEGLTEGRAEGLTEGLEKGLEKGLVEGRAEGDAKARAGIVRHMLQEGIPAADIAKWTGCPLPEVERLSKDRG